MDLTLLDYRRRVADLYRQVRSTADPAVAHRTWIDGRHELFADHPQSPVADRASFTGIDYFDHDPSWRLVGRFVPGDDRPAADVAHSGDGTTPFRPIGTVTFHRDGTDHELEVLWLAGYGGGVFLPFRDATNGDETYGGGRYLLDTVKGADLGHQGDDVVLDFNFAYHPSCVHDDSWSCPLAPPGNHLDVTVRAGERLG
ncbi:DUF1684 domain-containing protein [Salsipaludibacter albus]|uniref:DUF1684 domain-containing protein n=1 Tax=Salsipaludibacter albus TaxID=2849650 RepID=UPI001EE40BBE|nr:DUF1684 domain-containing protein [Salsipaludibacter albus]MBY5163298.1 DUF1684 domain-containing protein [Salsipaludibacter albus]